MLSCSHTPDALWWFIWGYSIAATLAASAFMARAAESATTASDLRAENEALRERAERAEAQVEHLLATTVQRGGRGRFVSRAA